MSEIKHGLQLLVGEKYSELEKYFKYVIDTFNEIYAVPNSIEVCYGFKKKKAVIIKSSNSNELFKQKRKKPDLITFIEWNNTKIPLLFHKDPIVKLFEVNDEDNTVLINADLLSSAFYFLSCWQEYVDDKKDEMGRFPFGGSLINDLDIVNIPVVNYYFLILLEAVEIVLERKGKVSTKHGDNLKVGISHDIDQCQTGWLEDNYRMFISGNRLKAMNNIFRRIGSKDIWFNFDQILDFESRLGIKSTFFFIAKHKKAGKYSNADYRLNSDPVQKMIIKLIDHDYEVGIHGSIGSGYDSQMFNDEVNQFESKVEGGRFHYLMIDIPQTWKVIENAGLTYDSTLGFPEKIGFRNGFCLPFRPYDFENEKPFSFWEFPMNVMDKTLMQPYYMGLDPDEAIESVIRLINEIEKWNGYFIINWHNNTLTGFKYRAWFRVFEEILNYCLGKNADITSIKKHHTCYIQNIKS